MMISGFSEFSPRCVLVDHQRTQLIHRKTQEIQMVHHNQAHKWTMLQKNIFLPVNFDGLVRNTDGRREAVMTIACF